MLDRILEHFAAGIDFVRNRPQIVYTIAIAIAIPVAFFWTNERFSSIARYDQDRLEYSRLSFLQDGFVLFAAEHMEDPSSLSRGITKIISDDETIVEFRILGPMIERAPGERFGRFPVLASMREGEIGEELIVEEPILSIFGNAAFESARSFNYETHADGARYRESIRAIVATSSSQVTGFAITRVSMAQADAKRKTEIRNAYLVSIAIVLVLILLLARQARIIDYATLYKKLEEIDKMKDDFVSLAAHELRSPLTIIRGYVDIIVGDSAIAPEQKKVLSQIDTAAQQLNVLIGDILDVAKLQEGRMSFNKKTMDVSEVIASVTDAFMQPAKEKGLGLFYARTPLPPISVDPDRFRQVMINLVGNAIKYTPKGEVRVVAYAEKGFVRVRVSDTGMGMTAEEQEKLFQKFYRVKNKDTERITGTGLGLWITERIVRAMQGTITVESIKWKGTDFIVSFPLA